MAEELSAILDAIAQVESGNDANAMGDQTLRYPAYGAYQMRQLAYQDVVREYPQYADIPLEEVLGNLPRQRELAEAYLTILKKRYGMKTLEEVVGAYNAGAGSIKKGRIPTDYIQKVKARMTP